VTEKRNGGLAVAAGDGKYMENPITDLNFIATAEQTDGLMLVFETIAPSGEGPPLHLHTREEEAIYVVSGDFRWKIGDTLSDAPSGSFAFLPRGVPHAWQNVGDQPGKLLIVFVPAGMEGFFERFARATEFDPEKFRAAGAEVGMETLGPPLAVSDPL
jgi:quercetin dioxygenase-like cupin family protein